MTDEQLPKPKRKKPEKKRITEQQLVGLGDIFPGFALWYRANYDETGNLLPSGQIPGLTQVKESESENNGEQNTI